MSPIAPSPPPASPLATEAEYCAAILHEREWNFARLNLVAGLVVHAVSLAVDWLYAFGPAEWILPAMHVVFLCYYGLGARWTWSHARSPLLVSVPGLALTVGTYAWIFYYDIVALDASHVVRSWTGFTAFAIASAIFLPSFATVVNAVYATILAVTGAAIWLLHDSGWRMALIWCFGMALTLYFRMLLLARFRHAARQEFIATAARVAADRAAHERELELARLIHDSCLDPGEARLGAFRVRGTLVRHESVGGGWFAVRTEPGGRGLVIVAEALGKGLRAALVVNGLQALWAGVAPDEPMDVRRWLEDANATLLTMSERTRQQAVVGILELASDGTRYWSAGDLTANAVIGEGAERRTVALQGRGATLGSGPDAAFAPATVPGGVAEVTLLVGLPDAETRGEASEGGEGGDGDKLLLRVVRAG